MIWLLREGVADLNETGVGVTISFNWLLSWCWFFPYLLSLMKWMLNPRYRLSDHTRQLKAAVRNCASCYLTWAPYTYLSSIFPPSVWPPMSHTWRVTFTLPVEEKRDKIIDIVTQNWPGIWVTKSMFLFFQITDVFILFKVHPEVSCIRSLRFKVAISIIIANTSCM